MRPSAHSALARLALGITLLVALLAACSSEGDESSVDEEPAATESEAPSDEAKGDEAPPDEPPPIERLRGVVSPAEFERFEENRGLVANEEGATPGLTLVMPLNSTMIHLVDLDGTVEHTWETEYSPGGWCYLMDDGTLVRSARSDDDPHFKGGGIGGVMQRIAPDGEVLWQHVVADEIRHQHHDIEVLPNGNILYVAWERKSADEAVSRGRDPRGVGAAGLWADAVFEIRPTPPVGAEVVWSWHAWDHLVQDRDPKKPNHGVLSDHPERFDVNAAFEPPSEITEEERRALEERKQQMAALGYGGGDDEDDGDSDDDDRSGPPRNWDATGDWMHTNSVAYHEDLDLIVLSSPELGEIFVIDHSTTTEEAAGSEGGRWGRGGDLLWRWGNPQNYGLGDADDQRLFYQHDPRWLRTPEGLELLVFNNGGRRPDGTSFSEVLELTLPFHIDEGFFRDEGWAFGPEEPTWSYSDPETFFSAFISGSARLASGNTLVCSGAVGRLFEVTPDGEIVWDYYSTLGGEVDPPEHAGKAPQFALYRVDRYAEDHPGIEALR
ncbi:MAG: aryl-sulfate sulfotransferase [Planctomycetota bacterium]